MVKTFFDKLKSSDDKFVNEYQKNNISIREWTKKYSNLELFQSWQYIQVHQNRR